MITTETAQATLTSWLLEQIEEDERAVRDLLEKPAYSEFRMEHRPIHHAIREDPDPTGAIRFRLAECDAKRITIALCTGPSEQQGIAARAVARSVLQLLALPYAERPGYREEWRP